MANRLELIECGISPFVERELAKQEAQAFLLMDQIIDQLTTIMIDLPPLWEDGDILIYSTGGMEEEENE